LEEVRDPQSRMQLAALPLTLEFLEPDAEAMTKGKDIRESSLFCFSCVRIIVRF
jgi:hypothetical protein